MGMKTPIKKAAQHVCVVVFLVFGSGVAHAQSDSSVTIAFVGQLNLVRPGVSGFLYGVSMMPATRFLPEGADENQSLISSAPIAISPRRGVPGSVVLQALIRASTGDTVEVAMMMLHLRDSDSQPIRVFRGGGATAPEHPLWSLLETYASLLGGLQSRIAEAPTQIPAQ